MKILLLGYGLSNKAVYNYFNKDNSHQIEIICDDEKDKLKMLYQKMPLFDVVFRSPGIKYDNPLYQIASALSKKTTNEVDYALEILKHQNVIAVTGSDGKTSLVKLLEHVLNHYKSAISLGNIGVTLIDKIDDLKRFDYLILELSSFQIENLTYHFPLGVIKNIHQNHLDTYQNKYLYYANKVKLINHVDDLILGKNVQYQRNNAKNLKYNIFKKGRYIYENEVKLLDVNKLRIKDKSFLENVIITLKVLKYYNLKYFHIEDIINTFACVKYRLEYLGNYKDVTFINDGKSSTSASSRYAYENYKGKKVLILGGIHKSGKFCFKINPEDEVLIYGLHRKKIYTELKYGKLFDTLNEVLKSIDLNDKKTIIFSPGCSSFDQYTNYIERSIEFEKWVKQWIK